jgi:hypothetical protein
VLDLIHGGLRKNGPLHACLVHATQSVILDSNPENRGSHSKKSCLVHGISMRI